MVRAEITQLDEKGNIVTKEVEDAAYDDDGLLYIHGDQMFQVDEIINMKSYPFCHVRFIREDPVIDGPCAVEIVKEMM